MHIIIAVLEREFEPTQDELCRIVGVSKGTAADWRNFIYEITFQWYDRSQKIIGGKNVPVEIATMLFAERKTVEGKLGLFVFIAVDKISGQTIFHVRNGDMNEDIVMEFIKKGIKKESILVFEKACVFTFPNENEFRQFCLDHKYDVLSSPESTRNIKSLLVGLRKNYLNSDTLLGLISFRIFKKQVKYYRIRIFLREIASLYNV